MKLDEQAAAGCDWLATAPTRAIARAPALGWRGRGVALGMLGALMFLLAVVGYLPLTHGLTHQGRSFIDNVFPFWAWSRFLHETAIPAHLYDFSSLDAFQHRIDPGYRGRLPFAYPPSFLLLLWPLGLLALKPAYAAFLGVNLAAYVAATWQRGWGRLSAALALTAPSTVLAVTEAQTSLLVAALLFTGCRLVGRRPILAGVLFGLMSFKPQFGLLVPIALVSAREWRCFAAAGATVLLSILASGLAFGWATWVALPRALRYLGSFILGIHGFDLRCPTVVAGLHLLGAGPGIAQIGQTCAILATGITIFLCFRRGFSPLASAALMVGAFFTTPYAGLYDLPIVTCSVLCVWLAAQQDGSPLRAWEYAIMAAVIVMPYVLFVAPPREPYGVALLLLLFGLILRRTVVSHTEGSADRTAGKQRRTHGRAAVGPEITRLTVHAGLAE